MTRQGSVSSIPGPDRLRRQRSRMTNRIERYFSGTKAAGAWNWPIIWSLAGRLDTTSSSDYLLALTSVLRWMRTAICDPSTVLSRRCAIRGTRLWTYPVVLFVTKTHAASKAGSETYRVVSYGWCWSTNDGKYPRYVTVRSVQFSWAMQVNVVIRAGILWTR